MKNGILRFIIKFYRLAVSFIRYRFLYRNKFLQVKHYNTGIRKKSDTKILFVIADRKLLNLYLRIKFKRSSKNIMKRKSILFAALLAVVTFFTSANIADAENTFPIGSKLDGFTMSAPDGKEHSYKDLKGKNGTLIVFLSAQCPVVKMYNDRINELAEAYKAKGINFVGIYSNHTESLEWVTEHSKENYKFPVLIDKNNVFADKLGASFTPEVYYFNANDVHIYHGAIDNDRSGNNVSKTFLKTAFNEKLAGKEITEKDTKAFGCSIKRIKDSE